MSLKAFLDDSGGNFLLQFGSMRIHPRIYIPLEAQSLYAIV